MVPIQLILYYYQKGFKVAEKVSVSTQTDEVWPCQQCAINDDEAKERELAELPLRATKDNKSFANRSNAKLLFKGQLKEKAMVNLNYVGPITKTDAKNWKKNILNRYSPLERTATRRL